MVIFHGIAHAAHHQRMMRYAVSFGLILGGGESSVVNSSALKRTAKLLGGGWKNIRGIKNFSRAINDIDDRVDNMTISEVIACGDAHLGTEPSPFILNHKIVSQDNWKRFNEISDLGLASREELISLLNLMAVCVVNEKKAAQEFQKTHNKEARRRMVRANLDLSIVLAGAIRYYLDPKPKLFQSLKELHTADLVKIYPKSAQIGEIIQMQDDLRDILFDMRREMRTGIPCCNIFLADLHERGYLADRHFLETCSELIDHQDVVRYRELPFPLREVIRSRVDEAKKSSSALPYLVKKTLNASWDTILSHEFKPKESVPMETMPLGSIENFPIRT